MPTLREGTATDLPFLEEMLYEAFFWSGDVARPPLIEARSLPEFSISLAGWGRPGDAALIAEYADTKAGAVWFRLWTPEAHSYGFVDSKTPELGLAILPRFRGRGIGRRLLQATLDLAAKLAYPALSLSVAPENPARHLYESEGFQKVGEVGTSWTLLRQLP